MGYELDVVHPAVECYIQSAYEGRYWHHFRLPSGGIADFIVFPNPSLVYMIECKGGCDEFDATIVQVMRYTEEWRNHTGMETLPVIAIPKNSYGYTRALYKCLSRAILLFDVDSASK